MALNVPVHGQCDKRRLSKVQSSTRPGNIYHINFMENSENGFGSVSSKFFLVY